MIVHNPNDHTADQQSRRLVRDPATKLVIADGAEVDPNEPYFARLLADGDLVPAPAPAAPVTTRRPSVSNEDAA